MYIDQLHLLLHEFVSDWHYNILQYILYRHQYTKEYMGRSIDLDYRILYNYLQKKRRRNKQKNIILLLLFLVTPCHASIWISDKITIDFIHLLNKRYNSFGMNTIHSNSYDLIRRFKTNRCSCFFNRFTMCSQFRILNVQG